MLRANLKHLRSGVQRRFASAASSLASQQALLSKYPIGLNLHGFVIENVQPIPEFSLVAVLLKHQQSGSEHLHLDSPSDINNVFSIAFKTNPPDATGVPHILEHTTLCGSYKYPVRDPFFKMTNRSLSNFMNAMTGHDFTFYPFATTNAKDFQNLMDVYLSSVFEPLLTYEDFIQEGWRLENKDIKDSKSDLEFKGVVYNEMKGQNSNSSYYFYIKYLESIYPSLNNSGGDPAKILNLEYEDLLDFHTKNYHPSNSKTFTYGSLPLINHLQSLNKYFSIFGARIKNLDVKQPLFKDITEKKTNIDVEGPLDSASGKSLEEQYKSSITWNLGDPLDSSRQYELFKWKILSSLLFDGHNAPLYQDLIENEFGDDFSANSGLDTTTALFSFTVGVNNLTVEKVEALESKIVSILKEKALPEFENPTSSYGNRVNAILHQLELNFKKHKPDFGLGLLNSIVPSWVNGLDPVQSLRIEPIIEQFKADYASNGLKVFADLLTDTILNPDTQRVQFTMKPIERFNEKLAEEEEATLKTRVEKLSDEDKEIIHKRSLNLSAKQAEEQDTEVLPTLTLSDIPTQGTYYPVVYNNDISGGKTSLQKRVVDTNGLVYAAATKDISYLPTKYYKYISLFTSCLTNLAGTSATPIHELETKIQEKTGGISFNTRIVNDPFDISKASLQFSLSGMALRSNTTNIYDLWKEILTETKFDGSDELVVSKLSTLIKNMGQNQYDNIADRGHSYAAGSSSSRLLPSKYISDIISGLSQVQFVLELNSNLEKQGKEYLIKEVLPVLKEIQDLLNDNNASKYKYRLVGDEESINENEVLIEKFDDSISTLNHNKSHTEELQNLLVSFNSNKLGLNSSAKTLIDLPFQVSYSSLAKSGASYASKDGAALQVLSQLYTFKHLHSIIREANGAYGGGLTYDGLSGLLNFYSYRDPNPLKSVKAFEDSFPYGLSANWTEKDLQEAKLRIFQSVDAPTNISSQGSTEFYDGITNEMRQERRENFLNITGQDLNDVVDKYLVGNDVNSITVIGDNANLQVSDDWEVQKLKL
ncbi:peptidase M16C associated-domain-containing protein [Scheffersomyces coipomensis]|uniref:peptidase M16C associated-domain-containing protein n=1 Tax=Scheffersomyces coipomensis TaxID=1788519 RepID=UPI00315CA19B